MHQRSRILILGSLSTAGLVLAGPSPVHLDDPAIRDTVCNLDGIGCEDGVLGLQFPSALALSPDGLFVYVVSVLDDALVVLSLDEEAPSRGSRCY